MSLDFCRALPKAELHAHLAGSIRDSTILDIIDQGQSIYEDGSSELAAAQALLKMSTRNLSDCFKIFSVIHNVVRTRSAIERIVQEMLEDNREDGVAYLEIRSTPRCLADFSTSNGIPGSTTSTIRIPRKCVYINNNDESDTRDITSMTLSSFLEGLENMDPDNQIYLTRADYSGAESGYGGRDNNKDKDKQAWTWDEEADMVEVETGVQIDAGFNHYVESVVRALFLFQVKAAREASSSSISKFVSSVSAAGGAGAAAGSGCENNKAEKDDFSSFSSLVARLILSLNRTESPEKMTKVLQLAKVWRNVHLPTILPVSQSQSQNQSKNQKDNDNDNDDDKDKDKNKNNIEDDIGGERCDLFYSVELCPVVVGVDVSGDPTRGDMGPVLQLLKDQLELPPEAPVSIEKEKKKAQDKTSSPFSPFSFFKSPFKSPSIDSSSAPTSASAGWNGINSRNGKDGDGDSSKNPNNSSSSSSSGRKRYARTLPVAIHAGNFGCMGLFLYTDGVLFNVEWCIKLTALMFFYHIP